MNFIVNLLHFHLEFAFKYLVLFNFWGLRLRPTKTDLTVAGELPKIDPARFVPAKCFLVFGVKCAKNTNVRKMGNIFRNRLSSEIVPLSCIFTIFWDYLILFKIGYV